MRQAHCSLLQPHALLSSTVSAVITEQQSALTSLPLQPDCEFQEDGHHDLPLELRYLAQHLAGMFIICGRREGRREEGARKGKREDERDWGLRWRMGKEGEER